MVLLLWRLGCWFIEYFSKDGVSFCIFYYIVVVCMIDWDVFGWIVLFVLYREDLVMVLGCDVMIIGEEDDGVYVLSGNLFGKYLILYE